jgi:hypothetical protein
MKKLIARRIYFFSGRGMKQGASSEKVTFAPRSYRAPHSGQIRITLNTLAVDLTGFDFPAISTNEV